MQHKLLRYLTAALVTVSMVAATPLFALADSVTAPAESSDTQACSTLTLTSGAGSQTAGYTETAQAGPGTALLAASYSNGVLGAATITTPVVPPWIDPATDGNFAGSGATWISTHTSWPGGVANTEGSASADQWRMFQDSFTLPAGAVVSSANLYYSADNASDVYLNGNATPIISTGDTYGAPADPSQQHFANVFTTAFTPTAGANTMNFVVRNWGGDFTSNPTGLLYRAVVEYCVPITPPPPATVVVTIDKFIDGAQATAVSANSASFPMSATWNAANIGAGTGTYALDTTNTNPYEAATVAMTSDADYSTNEIMNGTVGADCAAGAPFALVGYSTGNTLAEAVAGTVTATIPAFTGLTSDKFVIVHNHLCPVLPATVKVSIDKYVDGALATAVSANSASFPMSATWNAVNIGAGTGTYAIGPVGFNSANAYEAITADMTTGADYTTSEITSDTDVTSNVAPIDGACTVGKFRLLGYKSSSVSFADALTQSLSATAPAFTGLIGDRYVLVMNETCPTTASLTVQKAATGGDATFSFTADNGILPFTITTVLGTGSVTLNNLAPGTYHITESALAGWTQADSECSTVTLAAGDAPVCVVTNTKNVKLGEIRGTKFEDKDGDGKLKDGDHHRVPGVTVYLDANNNGVLDAGETSVVTDSKGNYRFIGLVAGTYHVREVVTAGWMQTYPSTGKYDITLATGKISKKNNFGNFKLGTISGMKYNDTNANGRKNSGETGLAGWTIQLTKVGGGTLTTVTDANGNYTFSDLGPGTYKLTEVMQATWRQTDHPGTVRVRSGTTSTHDDFGNTQKPVVVHGGYGHGYSFGSGYGKDN